MAGATPETATSVSDCLRCGGRNAVSRPAQDLQRRGDALGPPPGDDGHMTSSSPSRAGAVSDGRPRDVRIWQRAVGRAKTPSDVPVYRADLYSHAAIRDPYP